MNSKNLNFAALVVAAAAAVAALGGQRQAIQLGEGIDWGSLLSAILPAVGVALIAAANYFGGPVAGNLTKEVVEALLKLLAPEEAKPEPAKPENHPLIEALRKLLRERLNQ